jgi:hypothetical protein
MLRQIFAVGVGVVLVALPAGASASGAAASSGANAPSRVDVSSSVEVATGTVTGPRGAAVAGGTVDVYAWPSDAVLQAMKPGQTVPLTLLAKTNANAAGRYTLRIPAARLKSAAVASADSGYVNLEIESPAGIWFLSDQTGSPSAAPTVNLDSATKWPCGTDPQGRLYGFSSFKLVKHLKPAWAVVGQGYIVRQKKTAGDWVNFSYTQGSSRKQTSTLGLGISSYGLSAGFSGYGTNTSTASRSAGFPNSASNAWFRTEFSTGLFRGSCYGLPYQKVPRVKQHGACPTKYYVSYVHKCIWMVESTGWFGGANTQHPAKAPSTPAGNCAPYEKGSHYDGDFGKAQEWSSGFSIGAAVGIKGVNLKADFSSSTQTGYDTNAVMYYHFAKAGYLCGTNGGPATAAILVQRGTLP